MAAAAAATSQLANARNTPVGQTSSTGQKPLRDDDRSLSLDEAAELRRIEQEAEGEEAVRTEGLYEEKRGTRGKISKKPWFIIDPRTSKFIGYWDGISTFALIFTAIVTFVEVAFVEASCMVDGLFIINRCVDCIFIMDVCLNFNLMYPHQGSSPTDTVRWVHDPKKIRWHYIKSWFFLDVFSIAVSGFDFMSLGGNCGGGTSSFKVFRIIRVARLIKLVRLARSSRIMKRLESRFAINYNQLALIKCMVGLIIAGHWFACIWGLITTFEDPWNTWYYSYEYCWFVAPADHASLQDQAAAGDAAAQSQVARQLEDEENYKCKGPTERYVAALYWAIMTITSIGYGDIAATNTYEQLFCTVLMLAGGMVWGMVIATFCGVIASMDPKGTEFRKTMDDLNSFMALQGLPNDMRIQLREYFHQTRHLQVSRANKALIENMSPMLQGQVVWKINERWLRHVWFLRAAEDKFMVQLSLELVAAVFAPAELCPSGYMYISHRGIALYGGRVLTSGKVWGEDMILSSPHLRSKYAARCMTYVEVYMIERDQLLNIAKNFPPTLRIIRRSAFRLAFRREMIRRAQDSMVAAATKAGNKGPQGSVADRLMVSISSKEAHDLPTPTNDHASGPGSLTPSLPPLAAPASAGVSSTALRELEVKLHTQMQEQHAAVLERLAALSEALNAIKSSGGAA